MTSYFKLNLLNFAWQKHNYHFFNFYQSFVIIDAKFVILSDLKKLMYLIKIFKVIISSICFNVL